MLHEEQHERGKFSLQLCINRVMQPYGSRLDDDSIVEADAANCDIINSRTNIRHISETVENSLVNEFSTPHSSLGGRYSSHQPNLTTSTGEDNTPRPRHPLYTCFDSRLRSYATWRQFQQFDTSALAEAGFYNIGEANGIVIRCFFCATELVNPGYNDNPFIEHIKKSSSCGYLKQKLGEHGLAAYQERISNAAQTSLQTDGSSGDGTSASSRNPVSWSTSEHIRSPHYQAYSVRLASFARWPNDIRQRPAQVADAGFYYTGLHDVVRCFACDGGMKNWDPDDDPWIEHARWFPQCPFVRRVKGQEFIDLVRRMTEESDEDEDAVVHSTFQPNNPMADTPTLRNEMDLQTDQVNESSVLETDAARSVLDTGYSRAAVAKAINKLLTKGQTEYKADHIMNVIFEMESSGQLLMEYNETTESRSGSEHRNQINGLVLTLHQENERLRQSIHCVSCRTSKRNILLLPCTHFCLCMTCAETSSICPVCYKIIREKIKTYVI